MSVPCHLLLERSRAQASPPPQRSVCQASPPPASSLLPASAMAVNSGRPRLASCCPRLNSNARLSSLAPPLGFSDTEDPRKRLSVQAYATRNPGKLACRAATLKQALPFGARSLPGPGMEPASPAPAAGVFTTRPPGKSRTTAEPTRLARVLRAEEATGARSPRRVTDRSPCLQQLEKACLQHGDPKTK